MGGHRCFNTVPQTHPSSDKWAISDWGLRLQSHCVWPGRRATHWQSCQQQHLNGVTFYWQSAFSEHIDSLNWEHQPNNLLKAIVCFLGLAKHLVHVIQPCKIKLQSYFFEEKLSQLAQIMITSDLPGKPSSGMFIGHLTIYCLLRGTSSISNK